MLNLDVSSFSRVATQIDQTEDGRSKRAVPMRERQKEVFQKIRAHFTGDQ